MKRSIWSLLLLCSMVSANAGEFTILGGLAKFVPQDDGTYWNRNQPSEMKLISPAAAIRYEGRSGEYGLALQYTYFGVATVDALAVTKDAPDPGGYDRIAGACVGPCAELARWKVESEAQSIAIIGAIYFERLMLEAGLNLYEVRTKANVVNTNGSLRFQYKENRFLDWGPMLGIGYFFDPSWSIRAQFWKMEGRSKPGEDEIAQAAFGAGFQTTLFLGYTRSWK